MFVQDEVKRIIDEIESGATPAILSSGQIAAQTADKFKSVSTHQESRLSEPGMHDSSSNQVQQQMLTNATIRDVPQHSQERIRREGDVEDFPLHLAHDEVVTSPMLKPEHACARLSADGSSSAPGPSPKESVVAHSLRSDETILQKDSTKSIHIPQVQVLSDKIFDSVAVKEASCKKGSPGASSQTYIAAPIIKSEPQEDTNRTTGVHATTSPKTQPSNKASDLTRTAEGNAPQTASAANNTSSAPLEDTSDLDTHDVPVFALGPTGKIVHALWIYDPSGSLQQEQFCLLCSDDRYEPKEPLDANCVTLEALAKLAGHNESVSGPGSWKSCILLRSTHGPWKPGTTFEQVSNSRYADRPFM